MNTRELCEIAKIDPLILNVWIQRGHIPGVKVGTRGVRREFDQKTATHVVIMCELVRLGFGAPDATEWATDLPALINAIEELTTYRLPCATCSNSTPEIFVQSPPLPTDTRART